MRILWIPHTPTGEDYWEGSRQFHLFSRIGAAHDLHWITWRQSKSASTVFRWGASCAERRVSGTEHTICLAPNLYRLLTRNYPGPHHIAINQLCFRMAMRRISRQVRPDVAVYSSSHHFTGFPDFNPGCPMVFDYVDRSPAWVEAAYIRPAKAVVAVSEDLAEAAAAYGKPAHVIPNGVDLERYASVTREAAKARLGLSDQVVVSIIGLTCSPSLYFLEAIAGLQRRIENLCLLVVGGGKVREAILSRAREVGLRRVVAPGAVPNSDVHWYFAASDVGLYPGEDIPYYHHASPLKVVEYSAVGAQVVSSPVSMFRAGWLNVRIAEPSAVAFEEAIGAALTDRRRSPALSGYAWETLAGQFETVLVRAAA